MLRISIFLIAMVSLLIFSVSNATEVILDDTPNVGDTTTITTVTTGNPVTTNNLLSQNWIDGSWVGDMFPDSSDINENTWLTGKDGKYAETILNSEDYVTLEEWNKYDKQRPDYEEYVAALRYMEKVDNEILEDIDAKDKYILDSNGEPTNILRQ